MAITSLQCGGAERVMTTMANYWVKRGWPVTLITLDEPSAVPFFELEPRVELVALGLNRPSRGLPSAALSNLRRIAALRRAVRASRPDAVISFMYMTNVLVLLATRGLGLPVLVSERNDPLTNPVAWTWRMLRRWTYAFEGRLVVQTERARDCLPPALRAGTAVIPNPVPPLNSLGRGAADGGGNSRSGLRLAGMGRLYRQKGFDLLIEAFARIKDEHPGWSLTIFGEGPQRARLEALRDELGLNGRVELPGCVKSSREALERTDLFVVSSRWEGWPTVLGEAMSLGLPVIAADCRNGPREIIRDGLDGVLVPPEDVGALAAALGRLMSDEAGRRRLASRAPEVAERFALEKVMGMWEDLLYDLVPEEESA